MTTLAGKHALITGGGSGIGAATALAMASAGATVTIAGRRREPLDACAARAQGIRPVTADITDRESTEALFDEAVRACGPLDIVVANAGAANSAPFTRLGSEQWQSMLDTNMTGTFNTFQCALTRMERKRWGRLIAVASTAGLRGYAYASAYAAAKHGVVGLVRSLAEEYAATPITVNAICPGFTETPLLERAVDNIVDTTGMDDTAARDALASDSPQKRIILPEEVADAIVWLCGPRSAAITGQSVSVSGGATT